MLGFSDIEGEVAAKANRQMKAYERVSILHNTTSHTYP